MGILSPGRNIHGNWHGFLLITGYMIQRSKDPNQAVLWWTRTILVSHRISHHIQLCFLVSLWIHDEFQLVDLDARRPDAQVAGVCGSSKNWEGLCAKAVGCHCLWDIVTSAERHVDWLSWVCQNPDWLRQVYQQQWDRDDSKSCCQELESVVEMFDVFCWGEDEQSKF